MEERAMKLVRNLAPGDEVRFPNGTWKTVREIVPPPTSSGGFSRRWTTVQYVGDDRHFIYQLNTRREVR